MTRKTTRVQVILLAGIGLMASLTALTAMEIVLRAIASPRYYVWPPGLKAIFRPEPGIMPGIEGESRFYINEHGQRGDPFPADPALRILAIGASTTECLFLDTLESWPYLLQESLTRAQRNGPRVWVGNAGKSALSTRNHVVQVDRLIGQDPGIHAVLLLVGINDFLVPIRLDSPYRPFPEAESLPGDEYEDLMSRSFASWPGDDSHYPIQKRTEIWRRLRTVKERYLDPPPPPPELVVQDQRGEVYVRWRAHRQSAASIRISLPDLSAPLAEYAANIRRIIESARSRGVRPIFATQPYLWRTGLSASERDLLWMGGIGDFQREPGLPYYSIEALASGLALFNETLLAVCRAERVDCIDLASQLPQDTSVFYDDVHFNESGSRQVARVLAEHLGRTLLGSGGDLRRAGPG